MRKIKNDVRVEGYVYTHDLSVRTVQNKNSENFGKEFINGSLSIQTDDEGLNVVQVHYSYVTPTTKGGKANRTYNALKQIMESNKTVLEAGQDNALKVVASGAALTLNDFYNAEDELISAKRAEGGFVTIVSELSTPADRNYFDCDMLITGVRNIEKEDEEPYITISGAVFSFNGALLPVEFSVRDKDGIKFFESLDASSSNPTFTRVWGTITSQTIITKKVEESAFGAPRVKEYKNTFKEWEVTGAETEPYEIGEDITIEEVKQAKANREIYLAGVKKRQEEYQAQKKGGNGSAGQSKVTAAAGGFDF